MSGAVPGGRLGGHALHLNEGGDWLLSLRRAEVVRVSWQNRQCFFCVALAITAAAPAAQERHVERGGVAAARNHLGNAPGQLQQRHIWRRQRATYGGSRLS